MKLWEITDELEALGDEIAGLGGELTPLMEQRLDAMEGKLEEKVERMALYIRELTVNAEAAKSEEVRLAGIRRTHERTAASIQRYLHTCLDRADVPKVNTPKVRVRIQRNPNPSCVLTGNLEDLPDTFTTTTTTVAVDKKAVLAAWEQTDGDPMKREAPEGFEIAFGSHIRIS